MVENKENDKESQNEKSSSKNYNNNNKKYLPGLEDDDPEREQERKNLWKVFGRETGAGKELFSLYKCHQAPKINYPKPKQKSAQELEQKEKDKKQCPQKTQIEYPPLSYKDVPKQFHPIDFVPKKKNEVEIKNEIEQFYANRQVPVNRGVDRKALIEKLQMKMKNQRGGLPKCAELPQFQNEEDIELSEAQKTQALKRLSKKHKNYTGNNNQDDQTTNSVVSKEPMEELNQLFDDIMKEIEERQEFLKSIENLDEPKLKEKIKKEIIERVSELQTVSELKKIQKNNK